MEQNKNNNTSEDISLMVFLLLSQQIMNNKIKIRIKH